MLHEALQRCLPTGRDTATYAHVVAATGTANGADLLLGRLLRGCRNGEQKQRRNGG
jgi:hypothetical protein